MGKITVKHYLNTNLKPYIINGEKYYTIYALVTANRQNTKVKSKVFNEYYTENDFAEIVDRDNQECYNLLQNEVTTIENIANEIISTIGIFDTALFSAIYNYYNEIFVFDIDIETYDCGNIHVNLFDESKNKLGIAIDSFFMKDFSLKECNASGMSLFTWFSALGQNELKRFLIESRCKYDVEEASKILNDIVFRKSFGVLHWILKGSQKYRVLIEKYNTLFEYGDYDSLYEKIGIEKAK